MTTNNQKPYYGIDAPKLMQFFFVAGMVALGIIVILFCTSIVMPTLKLILTSFFGVIAIYLLGMGILMIYASKVMKLNDNEKLLSSVQWIGDEQVLDIGCGRGLMLITAAKKLTSGKATGIDLWQQQDQANNNASATILNAQIEGVNNRIEIYTADMRKLPFTDNHFDIVTSNWTIHNLDSESDRQIALNEIIRVLKPGGTVLLNDIVNQTEYAKYLSACDMKNIQILGNGIRDIVLKIVSFGSFAPYAVKATK